MCERVRARVRVRDVRVNVCVCVCICRIKEFNDDSLFENARNCIILIIATSLLCWSFNCLIWPRETVLVHVLFDILSAQCRIIIL